MRIYRSDHRDEEEGHTGSTAADDDHVVIRRNGCELQTAQFSDGRPVAEAALPSSPHRTGHTNAFRPFGLPVRPCQRVKAAYAIAIEDGWSEAEIDKLDRWRREVRDKW